MITNINNRTNRIDHWKYNLAQFIDIAERYNLQSIYNTIRPGHGFSILLEDFVLSGRSNFDDFKTELRDTLSNATNQKPIIQDIQSLLGIKL